MRWELQRKSPPQLPEAFLRRMERPKESLVAGCASIQHANGVNLTCNRLKKSPTHLYERFSTEDSVGLLTLTAFCSTKWRTTTAGDRIIHSASTVSSDFQH
ncbi:hypothetical protein GCK32_011084 [Trichostrongylus colubriformis]|uniref:Uncharacterized protein n=1 Tax=Trichostrongylus colubriformis TaxID=6319 RepID=A0AAN8F6H0_TRICO